LLDLEILAAEDQIPVGLLDLGGNRNHLAAELFLGNREVVLRNEDLILGDLGAKISEQGLRAANDGFTRIIIIPRWEGVGEGQRRALLRRFEFSGRRATRGGEMRL